MKFEQHAGLTLAIIDTEGPALGSEADALDMLGQTFGSPVDMVVIPTERLAPEFFELENRLAGHFIQKLQNYQMRLAIIGDISEAMSTSKSLSAFVTETNRIGHHVFAKDRAALLALLERHR